MRVRRIFSFKDEHGNYNILKIVASLFLLFILLSVFFFGMLYGTGVGYRAILIDPSGAKFYGASNGAWSIKLPWQSAITIHYSMQTLGFWGDGSDPYADMPAIHARSSDMIDHTVDAMVRWSYNPNELIRLYENYQDMDIVKFDVVGSTIRDAVRDGVKEFTTLEINQDRDLVAQKIKELLVQYLINKESINFAIVTESIEFELRDIVAPPDVIASFERIRISENDIQTALNNQQEGVIRAETEAKIRIIEYLARKNATIIEAQGIAEALNLLAEQTGVNASDLVMLKLTLEGYMRIAEANDKTIIYLGFDENGNPLVIPIE